MTCKNTLQARFVSGRLTSIWLFIASLLVWGLGVLLDAFMGTELTFKGYFVPLSVSLLCYIVAAVILDTSYLFERRVRWLSAMFMWLVAVSFYIHGTAMEAVAVLLLAVIVYKLFACKQGEDGCYGLFSVFSIVGCTSLVFPQVLLLLPVFALYGLSVIMSGIRGVLAALIGFFMPHLVVSGFNYLFPGVMPDILLGNELEYLASFSIGMPTLLQMVLFVLQLVMLILFTAIFMNSTIPGKRYLRRRLVFLIYLNISLLLMSLFYNADFSLFYMMSLPSVAVMMGYVFTLKVTKPMNWLFIILNFLWISLFPFALCLRLL
ncbi:MAG: hypothetical protein J6U58_01125 [Bacteroidaceae bacterium]|nr:hypothetical protein [Bacteroidaceae bacterium]